MRWSTLRGVVNLIVHVSDAKFAAMNLKKMVNWLWKTIAQACIANNKNYQVIAKQYAVSYQQVYQWVKITRSSSIYLILLSFLYCLD